MESYKKDDDKNVKVELKDQWLDNMKKRHEVNSKFEADALKSKPIQMKDLDYVKLPEKMNVVGQPGSLSVKSDTKVRGANKIHGGEGANFRA